MNKIEEAIIKIEDYKVMDAVSLSNIKEMMIEKAYNEQNFADLVNINIMAQNTLSITDMIYGNDYEVVTGTKYSKILQEEFTNGVDYEKAIELYIKNNDSDYVYEDWLDLETTYDEIYYNIAYRFANSNPSYENAIESNLGILNIPNTDESFLFLKGCGKDMSYTIMQYLIREYHSLPIEYSSNSQLNWLNVNTNKEVFIELMVMAGLDRDRLIKSINATTGY